jgi:tRNA (guanine37-N1)-methyltransferase
MDVRPLQSAKQRAKDGRQGRQTLASSSEPVQRIIKHFIMNLPASAIEFLDAFRQFSENADQLRSFYGPDAMPMIHCYCFTRELEQPQAEIDILKVGCTCSS